MKKSEFLSEMLKNLTLNNNAIYRNTLNTLVELAKEQEAEVKRSFTMNPTQPLFSGLMDEDYEQWINTTEINLEAADVPYNKRVQVSSLKISF